MADPRELLSSYRELLSGLRRGAGPAGPLIAPLQATADLLDQVLVRQQEMEAQLAAALQPMEALVDLARDAPTTLRTQAKAFTAAAASFEQAAQMMNLQADLLEGAAAALGTPARLLRATPRPKRKPRAK